MSTHEKMTDRQAGTGPLGSHTAFCSRASKEKRSEKPVWVVKFPGLCSLVTATQEDGACCSLKLTS